MRDPHNAVESTTPQLAPVAGIVLISIMVLIGGITPVMAKEALQELPPISMGAFRFLIAAGLLLAAQQWRKWRNAENRLPLAKRDRWRVIATAVLCVPVNQVCFLLGIKFANASHAGLFYALNPVLVYLLTRLTGASRGSRIMATAAVIAFSGAAVIALGSLRGGGDSRMFLGDLLLLGAVASWSLYAVISQPLAPKYGGVRVLTWTLALGALLYTPAIFVDGSQFNLFAVSPRAVLGFFFITVCTSFIGYMIWFFAMARIDLNRLAIVSNAAPVVAVVAAYLIRGEPLTRNLLFGGTLIVSAIFMANWDKLKKIRAT